MEIINIILVILVIYLLYRDFTRDKFTTERQENTNNQITLTESIKNLGLIAKRLQEGGTFKFLGDFEIDGKLTVTKQIVSEGKVSDDVNVKEKYGPFEFRKDGNVHLNIEDGGSLILNDNVKITSNGIDVDTVNAKNVKADKVDVADVIKADIVETSILRPIVFVKKAKDSYTKDKYYNDSSLTKQKIGDIILMINRRTSTTSGGWRGIESYKSELNPYFILNKGIAIKNIDAYVCEESEPNRSNIKLKLSSQTCNSYNNKTYESVLEYEKVPEE